jgi:hypothetical protein
VISARFGFNGMCFIINAYFNLDERSSLLLLSFAGQNYDDDDDNVSIASEWKYQVIMRIEYAAVGGSSFYYQRVFNHLHDKNLIS